MNFLANSSGWSSIIIPLVMVTLSMLIPIVAIITGHLQKKEKMRLMEKAIEHGANLENFTLEEPGSSRRQHLPYRAGMITLSVGVGLAIASRVLPLDLNPFQGFMLVGGAITSCVGIAQLVNDYMNRERFKQE